VESTVIEELDKVFSVTGVDKLIDDLFLELKKQVKEIPDEITLARQVSPVAVSFSLKLTLRLMSIFPLCIPC